MAKDWLEPTFEGLFVVCSFKVYSPTTPFFLLRKHTPGVWNTVMLVEYWS